MCRQDDLSIKLNQSGIGGDIGGHLINQLCYADDLCLISLSSAGMQKLLDMCNTYAREHLLTYNEVNHIPCVSSPNILNFYLNKLEILKVDQCKYLGIMISIKKL